MTTLCIDDAGADLRQQIDITKANAQVRTREQCQLAMMRFHPACNLAAVMQLLTANGYVTERTKDGVTWVAPA